DACWCVGHDSWLRSFPPARVQFSLAFPKLFSRREIIALLSAFTADSIGRFRSRIVRPNEFAIVRECRVGVRNEKSIESLAQHAGSCGCRDGFALPPDALRARRRR